MSRFHQTILLATLLAAVPGPAPCSDAATGHEDHATAPAGDSQAVHDVHGTHGTRDAALPAHRWIPDAPLSRGMQRVRASTAMLDHGSHGHLDDAQVRSVAAELKAAVDMMFAECKLEPEPDAALHPLLARVLVASHTLSESGFDAGALAELQAVLARYPLLFDDPAWTASQSD